jgi:hypothetical protein
MNVNKINNAYHLEIKIFNHHDHGHGCLQIHADGSRINLRIRYDNVTLSPLLLPARVTNRSHSTYGSSARSDSQRAAFCPNSVVSGWKN